MTYNYVVNQRIAIYILFIDMQWYRYHWICSRIESWDVTILMGGWKGGLI
jgi:carbohydrate-binding DOMON domain-containing protein